MSRLIKACGGGDKLESKSPHLEMSKLFLLSFDNETLFCMQCLYEVMNMSIFVSHTNEIVPLRVQVGLIRQAALHHVEAQRVARPQRGQASAQRAVPLTHQPADALRVGTQLGQQNMREEEKGMGGPLTILTLPCKLFTFFTP